MKKYILLFISFFVFLIGNSNVYASVNDLNKCSEYAKTAVQSLSNNNIIKGDTKGNFNPKKELTRAEFVTMLVKTLGDIDTSKFEQGYNDIFKDVSDKHWAKKYIIAAQQYKLVSGISQNTFNPEGKITREQMANIFSQIIVPSDKQKPYDGHRIVNQLKDEISLSNWAKNGVEITMSAKIMEGLAPGIFSPKSYVTKEQAAVVLFKYLGTKQWFSKYQYLYNRNLEPKEGNYFTLGSSQQDMFKVMGKASGSQSIPVDTEIRVTATVNGGVKVTVTGIPTYYLSIISFGDSEVYLNGTTVVGWKNSGNLRADTGIPKTNILFKYGSSKEELFESMGTPKELIMVRNKVYATFKEGFIELENNKVTAWVENVKGGLRIGHGTIDPNSKGFNYDSSLEEVVKAMGIPSLLVKDAGEIVLQYGESFVYLYENLKVKDWVNKGELKIGTLQKDENAPPFTFGSTRGDVIRAMGLPVSISNQYDSEFGWNGLIWSYGSSKIHFNDDFLVDGWSNKGNLKLPVAVSQNKIPVRIGTSKKEILDAYGTPSYTYYYVIKYGNTALTFNLENKLAEIIIGDNNIKISQYYNHTNADFTIGASLDEVLQSMGDPDKMDDYYRKVRLYYGNSELCFFDNKLIGYTNKDSNLRINMGESKPGKYFNMFSTLNQLVDAMGTPDSFNKNEFGRYEVFYDKSKLILDGNNAVTTWKNTSNNLLLDKSVVEGSKITFGTPIAEVLKNMGAPDDFGGVSYTDDYGACYNFIMKYGESSIFAGPGQNGEFEVLGWINEGDMVLDTSPPAAGKQAIRLGDTREKVLSLKGLPKILYRKVIYPSYLYNYIFEYGKTNIEFDEYNKVSSIYNGNNDILLFDDSPKLPSGRTVDLNATKQEIRDVLGDPTGIDRYNVWQYTDGLKIIFNDQGKIDTFYGNKDSISLGIRHEGASEINVGSTLEDLVEAYGTPESYINYNASGIKLILMYIAPGEEKIIYKGKAYGRLDIDINDENKVRSISLISTK
ncbi:MAG TPA: S-layer homology domain-containing protein [Ruminiclostridium sp.]